MVAQLDWRRPLTLSLAIACFALALSWPMWRSVLGSGCDGYGYNGYGYYGYGSYGYGSYGYGHPCSKYRQGVFGYRYRPMPEGFEK